MTTNDSTPITVATAQQKERRAVTMQRREGFWFPEPSREGLLSYLEQLANDAPRQRERSIAITAEANNGKSSILKRYMKLHPSYEKEDRKVVPCISIDMSHHKRVEDLSIALLRALGDIDPEGGNHSQRILRFIALSREVGLQLTFLDEFHEAANIDKGGAVLRCVKGLMNEHIKVVPLGVDKVKEVFLHDAQLSSRFSFSQGKMTRISDSGVIKALMVNISVMPEQRIEKGTVNYIKKETKGIFGHICDLIEDTFVACGNLSMESLTTQRDRMDCLNGLS